MQTPLRSPTISALSKMRRSQPGLGSSSAARNYDSQVAELRTAVKMLKKDAEAELQLEVESQKAFEYLSSQVGVLRDAFSTLADVLNEEVDRLRTDIELRAEDNEVIGAKAAQHVKVVRSELSVLQSAHDTTKASLNNKITDLARTVTNVQMDLSALNTKVLSSNDTLARQVESNTLLCRELQAAANAGDLLARSYQSQQREDFRESTKVRGVARSDPVLADNVARLSHANIQASQQMASVTDLVAQQARTIENLQRTVEAQAAEMADIRAFMLTVGQRLADPGANGSSAQSPSRAAAEAAGIPSAADVRSLKTEMLDVKRRVVFIEQEHSAAAAALAQDVHTLADESTAIKVGVAQQVDSLYAKLRNHMLSVEKQHADDHAITKQQLELIVDRFESLQSAKSAADAAAALESASEKKALVSGVEASFSDALNELRGEAKALRSRLAAVEDGTAESAAEAADIKSLLRSISDAVEDLAARVTDNYERFDELETRLLDTKADSQKNLEKYAATSRRETNSRLDRLEGSLSKLADRLKEDEDEREREREERARAEAYRQESTTFSLR